MRPEIARAPLCIECDIPVDGVAIGWKANRNGGYDSECRACATCEFWREG